MFAMKRPRRAATEESLDPRVMTERQQLAFLLRTTAPSDASNSSSESFPSSESEGDEPPRRQPAKRSKTRTTRFSSAANVPPVIYCGRGRPPKNSIKLPKNRTHPHSRVSMRLSPRGHNTRPIESAVATAVVESLKGDAFMAGRALEVERKEREGTMKHDKNSPSSASDVALLSRSAATPLCALCCDLEAFCDAPLFLCPSCDRKYPTQQALGRVCMA